MRRCTRSLPISSSGSATSSCTGPGGCRRASSAPAQLGTCGYLHETPEQPILTGYWKLIWDGRIPEAIAHAEETGLDRLGAAIGGWFTQYPGRPDYFTHWGEAFRYAASVIGLPIGDYPHSRPPQGILPESAKEQIRAAYEKIGFIKQLAHA